MLEKKRKKTNQKKKHTKNQPTTTTNLTSLHLLTKQAEEVPGYHEMEAAEK